MDFKIQELLRDISEQATRKERAADDHHLLEGDLEIIARKTDELRELIAKNHYEGMKTFNLNDFFVVKITDYGKDYLIGKTSQEYWDHVIEPKKFTLKGEDWYRLQAHSIMQDFGGALWCVTHFPIIPNILIPDEHLT
jgi:hypothetical protein